MASHRETRTRLSRPHRRRVLLVIVATQLVLALATGLGMYAIYQKIDGNISAGQKIDHLVDEPTEEDGPLNILLLGVDTRDCEGCALDKEAGANASDTTILLHIAADRQSAYGISIPRDALVTRPKCETDDGEVVPGKQNAMWNEAYALGGAACTAKQTELLTGVRVDHYIAINFAGFKDMVNAIDGVTVCIPEDIDDDKHNIHLEAGTQTLRDQDALNYVRERYSTPNSDLGRMKRQQYFIASMTNKVVSAGTLARPDRLLRFANAITSSIETDADLASASSLVNLATELRNADLTNVKFVTVPTAAYPESSEHWGRLRILPSADLLWRRVKNDKPMPERLNSGTISADDSPRSPGDDASADGGSPSGDDTSADGTSPSDDASTDSETDGGSPSDPGPAETGLTPEEAAENGLCA